MDNPEALCVSREPFPLQLIRFNGTWFSMWRSFKQLFMAAVFS